MDPFKKVSPGDPFDFPAALFNAIVDAVTKRLGGQGKSNPFRDGTVIRVLTRGITVESDACSGAMVTVQERQFVTPSSGRSSRARIGCGAMSMRSCWNSGGEASGCGTAM